MRFSISRTRLKGLVLGAACLMGSTADSRADYSISNNLSGTSGGVESATGTTYLTAGFGSGSIGGFLSSVTLSLANRLAGTAEVDVYTDSGLQPGSFVGVLSHSGAYSATLANTTFTASGITLYANTNYWVVLKAVSGQFDWSWTSTNTGTGTGYQNTWGESDDSGGTWFTYDSYPTQMNVVMASVAVPEPSTLVLWCLGLGGVAWISSRSRTDTWQRAIAIG